MTEDHLGGGFSEISGVDGGSQEELWTLRVLLQQWSVRGRLGFGTGLWKHVIFGTPR